jgi:hypothetical protein
MKKSKTCLKHEKSLKMVQNDVKQEKSLKIV